MIRQTSIAQTLDFTADRARYDQCAKKLLSYTAVVAWILKSCTNEFSQYSVRYIMDNCIVDQPQMMEETVYGTTYAVPEQYDLTEVIIINLGDAEKPSEVEILDLLNVLFHQLFLLMKRKTDFQKTTTSQ